MSRFTNRLPRTRREWRRPLMLLAVLVVPLAFAGLFVGAVAPADNGAAAIPAAIVNDDQLVTSVAEDGSEQHVLAGRQLVTELTGDEASGVEWTITNADDAEKALAAGEVYAIVTVPADFSRSIVSLSGDDPQRAELSIRTDDAHNYLTGSIAQVVGDSLVTTFGNEVTTQVIAGLYSGMGELGVALADAATGASEISEGAGDLSSGLSQLTDGAASAGSGARSLAGGVDEYVGGVSQLAGGLRGFQSQISAMDATRIGVAPYTTGVSQLSDALAVAVGNLAADPGNAALLGQVQYLTGQLQATAANGPAVVGGVNTAFDQLAAGAGASAAGAEQLAASGGELEAGARGLASGLSGLETGAAEASQGAGALADGAGELASGLRGGADQIPSLTEAETEQAADVAAEPVSLSVQRDHEVSDLRQMIATLLVPLGLWIGALAVFLVLRPVARRTLSSTAAGGRIVLAAFARAAAVTAAQAMLLVALLHLALGVAPAMLPASILFSLVMALAFTAFHYLLTVALGRGGLVVSLLLLALQLVATGGLYPIQLIAEPFQLLSPLLPLTHGVKGMQAIVAGSGAATAALSALALVAFGVVSLVLAALVVRRARRSVAIMLAPAPA